MTRRRIVFYDKFNNKTYISPEFNGDKTEFIYCKTNDICNMNWDDIMKTYFSNVQTLDDFKLATENAQKEYISSITGTYIILQIKEITNIKHFQSIYGNNLYFI